MNMKNMSEKLLRKINDLATPVKIMHVCGSHEHTIMENGIRSLLQKRSKLLQDPDVQSASFLHVKLMKHWNLSIRSYNHHIWRHVKSSGLRKIPCRC